MVMNTCLLARVSSEQKGRTYDGGEGEALRDDLRERGGERLELFERGLSRLIIRGGKSEALRTLLASPSLLHSRGIYTVK